MTSALPSLPGRSVGAVVHAQPCAQTRVVAEERGDDRVLRHQVVREVVTIVASRQRLRAGMLCG